MRNLRFAIPALALALLLSSTVGLVAHDHAAALPKDGYDCVSDHRSDSHSASPGAATELRPAEPRHRHLCFGCRLAGNRSLALPKIEAASDPGLNPSTTSLPASTPRPLPLRTNVFLRGPPAC